MLKDHINLNNKSNLLIVVQQTQTKINKVAFVIAVIPPDKVLVLISHNQKYKKKTILSKKTMTISSACQKSIPYNFLSTISEVTNSR